MTKIRSWFLTGILVMTPLILTIYVAWAFITFVDNLVVPLVPFYYRPSNYLPFSIPGLGLIIVFIFTTLGLLLSFTLGASGAGDLAANPWINIFIASLFIYLAFSLFGYYEIQIPSSLRQYSLNKESKGGFVGILFMSLTFTLTSFT